MIQATPCLLVKDGKEILLAMKKRGFGVGKWNGVGGKMSEEDKDIMATSVRETEEEIGVRANNLEKVAVLSFYFPEKKEWNQDVHVFLAKEWNGDPKESEEMLPKWFKIDDIPFSEMWDDDKFWLPKILAGKKLKAKFVFDNNGDKIIDYSIEEVSEV